MGNNKEKIVILGYGGHAKSIVDSILSYGLYEIEGYTDIRDCKSNIRYLGTDDELKTLFHLGIHNAVLGIGYMGNSKIRDELVRMAKDIGFIFPVIIDPSATVANGAVIGEGSYVGKKTIINAEAKIGDFCIINTGAIIEHENTIDDYTHVAVGSILCGNVSVGHHSMIGAGATVIQGRVIGNNCIIGANSTVLSNVMDNVECYGVVKYA